jgi:hypothetical protein
MEVSGYLHAPVALPSGEKVPDNYWIGGWVGPRSNIDVVASIKIHFFVPEGNRTPVVLQVA